jgi:hypothetical protein
MKFIYLTCNISKLEQLEDLIRKEKINSYQIVENANGCQPSGNPRMNNSVWPGHNSIVFIQTDDKKTSLIFNMLKEMNKNIVNESERVLAASWSCENYLYFDEGEQQ